MFRKLLILLGLTAAGMAAAQTAAPTPTLPVPAPKPAVATVDADPALWVVKDADTTIYLFGTVHVLKPGLGWFDEGVKKAFDSSDELVLEMVQPDPAAMQSLVMAQGVHHDRADAARTTARRRPARSTSRRWPISACPRRCSTARSRGSSRPTCRCCRCSSSATIRRAAPKAC